MRGGLLELYRARGSAPVKFSARYGGMSPTGHIWLTDVTGPSGLPMADHVWIRQGHWAGKLPERRGYRVNLTAHIEPYWKASGEEDLGLFRVKVKE